MSPTIAPAWAAWAARHRFMIWFKACALVVQACLVASAMSCSPAQNFLDGDPAGGGHDGGLPGEGDMTLPPHPPCTMVNGEHGCPAGRICYMDHCVPDHGTCRGDDDCQNDTRCTVDKGSSSDGICIEWMNGQFDPQCKGEGFSATAFQAPVDRCHWPRVGTSPAAIDVVMTPLVIDLDGDGVAEIIFGAQGDGQPMRLLAIRSTTCEELYDLDAGLQPFSQLAAGDLDGDHKIEIVALLSSNFASLGHQVAIFDGLTGKKLAQSRDSFQMDAANYDCSGPALADLDGDGSPEIIVGGLALRWNKLSMTLDTIWNKSVTGATWGSMSVVNDLDGDGKPEVISGNRIFDGRTGADRTPSIMARLTAGGYPAIGDFNRDGAPDIVLIQSKNGDQHVSVIDVKNNAYLMEPTTIPMGWGGPPTVADFDGDGIPDFGTAGPRNYYVFSLDCLKTPKPTKCRGALPGVLWQSVTKDASSGGTASSVFDFNGDGRAEVVYRDECWLRVYNGPDGKTVFARPITSGTALEMPVVADVDNDGHADLVVPSDAIQGPGYCMDQNPERDTGMPHTGVTRGIFVLKDPMNRWMPSRPMWNQHTYHITNINDDGSIPAAEKPNWTSYNNYRQNVQGSISIIVPQPDATSRGTPIPEQTEDCHMQWNLYAQICNRGNDAIASMVPGTFYLTDPRPKKGPPPVPPPPPALCTAYTVSPIPSGKCETVSCAWTSPPSAPVDLWFRANDDGNGGRPQTQCKDGNDVAFLPGVSCMKGPG